MFLAGFFVAYFVRRQPSMSKTEGLRIARLVAKLFRAPAVYKEVASFASGFRIEETCC